MTENAPASLTGSLLARKGLAKPAALPEDNYSPFTKTVNAWKQDGESAAASLDDPQSVLPLLGETQSPDSGNDARSQDEPEAALTQIRVNRPQPVAPPPNSEAECDATERAQQSAPEKAATSPTGETAAEEKPAEDAPNAVATPHQTPHETLDATADTAPIQSDEPAGADAKREQEPVTGPVSAQNAVPPAVAAAALRQTPSVWRRHAMTFGLSFLVGGALAFVGWSIYSKGAWTTHDSAPVVAEAAPAKAVASKPPAQQYAEPAAAADGPKTAPTIASPAMDARPAAQTAAAPTPETAAAATQTAPAQPPGRATVESGSAEPRVLSVRFADDGRATIVGTAAPDSELVLLDNGKLLATLKAGGDGIWSYLGDAGLADGSHKFSVAAIATTVDAKVSTAPAKNRQAPAELPVPLPPPTEEGAGDASARDGVPVPANRDERRSSLDGYVPGRYVVQLASVPTETDAKRFWSELAARNPDLTEGYSLLVHSGTLAQGQTVFRVRAGPFASRQAAQQACRSFRAAQRDCLVVKRLEQRS